MEDQERQAGLDQLESLQKNKDEGNQTARELFQQISHISLCLSYDMVDKLRWWEKETLKLSDEEIDERIPHMSKFLDQLKTAYLQFSEIDF